MEFNKWLDTLLEEKNIKIDEEVFFVEHKEVTHMVEMAIVVDLCKTTIKTEQEKIKDALVYLDFKNADILDYFKHLAKAYVMNKY